MHVIAVSVACKSFANASNIDMRQLNCCVRSSLIKTVVRHLKTLPSPMQAPSVLVVTQLDCFCSDCVSHTWFVPQPHLPKVAPNNYLEL